MTEVHIVEHGETAIKCDEWMKLTRVDINTEFFS